MFFNIKSGARRSAGASALLISLLILSCALMFPYQARAESDGTEKLPLSHAGAYFIKNLETGSVLKSTDVGASIRPSSTVKIMAGLLLCERYGGSLDDVIEITPAMAKDNNASRSIGLIAGQKPTVRDLIYLTVCGSFNDALKALAIDGYSSPESLTAAMNERAIRLGMTSTHYDNPYGLDSDGARTCLSDLVILAEAAMNNGLFMTASSAKDYTPEKLPASYAFNNHNKLIGPSKYRNTECRGMNAGNTPGSGYSVVTVSEKKGISYLCIVMGADSVDGVEYSYAVANGLINWAFSSYENKIILKPTDIVCE
ncbi:MAG: D-alanyl-D-alanine carboxypeptidase, partial [Clostridia bacterium]|nr:D-alanyl-D-alanine carboxypeptidase [Clostridia bacterium]